MTAPVIGPEHLAALQFAFKALSSRSDELYDTGLHGASKAWGEHATRLTEIRDHLASQMETGK